MGGFFSSPAPRLARWDGEAWHDVGGGVGFHQHPPTVIGFDDGSGPGIFVAGGFRTVGDGISSGGFARWNPCPACYADCDRSGILDIDDFICFINRFAAGHSWANCDGNTVPPLLTVDDFTCFIDAFARGCP